MMLFRTDRTIALQPVECLDGNEWKKTALKAEEGGIILTDVTQEEQDILFDLYNNYDPNGLRGIVVTLRVEGSDGDDPEQINLLAIPHNGEVIRHQDRYYLVKLVVQGTNGSAAVFAKRISSEIVSSLAQP